MSNIAEVKEKTQKSELSTIENMIKGAVRTLGEAAPKHMSAERLVRIALTSLKNNTELYKCTPNSLMGAIFQSAFVGIEPNIEGQAYLIPFNNKRKQPNGDWKTIKEVQYVLGYKGLVELFYRHDSAISLDMQKVRQGDEFDFQYGTESYLKHKPVWDSQDVIYYYAIAKLKSGGTIFKVLTKDECIEHGKIHSKCFSKKDNDFYSGTPWKTDLDAMCLKTVLIQLMKLLPKSVALQKAISSDETIKTTIEPDMTEVKDETVWNGETVDVEKDSAPESDSDENTAIFNAPPSEVQENPDGSIKE